MKTKKCFIIIILLIVAYYFYDCFSCPIKGIYAYTRNPNVKYLVNENRYVFESEPQVILYFKNGCYIFEGEGEEFEEIVSLYGNNVKCEFIEVENNIPNKKEYLLTKWSKELWIRAYVESNGSLSLFMEPVNTSYREFYKIDK